MITQKMKYALKALLALADEAAKEKPQALTIEEIARRSGTPKRFLEHILLEVRNAGVIARIRDDRVLLDLRTVLDDAVLVTRLAPAREGWSG